MSVVILGTLDTERVLDRLIDLAEALGEQKPTAEERTAAKKGAFHIVEGKFRNGEMEGFPTPELNLDEKDGVLHTGVLQLTDEEGAVNYLDVTDFRMLVGALSPKEDLKAKDDMATALEDIVTYFVE